MTPGARQAAAACLAALLAMPAGAGQDGLADAGLIGGPACEEVAYAEPVRHYRHFVLGRAHEWGAMEIAPGAAGNLWATETLRPGRGRVFEDLAPRCADLDGDGGFEIVTVEAAKGEGARLAVWHPGEGRIAATPPLGRSHRWLAPAGIGDLDADGAPEIALVAMPHLEGRLEVWTLSRGGLEREAAARGFSNHRIGESIILSGIRDCGDGPELVLPDFDWTALQAVRVARGSVFSRTLPLGADRAGLARALDCAEAS